MSLARVRTAFVAALLLAQVALPALHAFAFADHPIAGTAQTLSSSSGAVQANLSHDANGCPICLASRQGRTGVIRAPLNAPALSLVAVATVCEREVAPPSAPELDSAPPRAPPVPALAFA